MTYMPSTTLESVWCSLTEENKLAIPAELETHIVALRTLRAPPGTRIGGLDGEGVSDNHGWVSHSTTEVITTIDDFVDWQFAVDMPLTSNYRDFLKSFVLPEPNDWLAFTHGDLWPPNIMVDRNENGTFKVTGIIDWETSGFYPSSWEQSRILRAFVSNSDDDWYNYVPAKMVGRQGVAQRMPLGLGHACRMLWPLGL